MITLSGATGADFLTNGVRIGDELVPTLIKGNAPSISNYLLKSGSNPLLPGINYDNILITSILGETSITIDAYLNGTALGLTSTNFNLTAGDSFSYNVVHNYTKDEMITNLVGIATGYSSKRTLLIWPPEAEWFDSNGNLITLDGTALTSAVAGGMSNYPAQQSFTNLPIAGPHKLHYSNTFFTPSQLNRLSDAGFFVLVQDTPGAQVYCRHQKTTSNASIQEQEFSITKTVDKLSLDVKTLVKPFIGKYNITQDLLTQLDDVTEQYLFNAKSQKAPYCGALIVNYSNKIIRANLEGQNLDLPVGTVEITFDIEVGYPANKIKVVISVQ